MDVNIQVIARMHSDFATKFGIPRQSGLVEELRSTIVFEPEFRNADALRGIEDFSHLWIIWQFSEAVRQGWSPTVRPPRLGGNTRMGVFATRSPFRPNNLSGPSPVTAPHRAKNVQNENAKNKALQIKGTLNQLCTMERMSGAKDSPFHKPRAVKESCEEHLDPRKSGKAETEEVSADFWLLLFRDKSNPRRNAEHPRRRLHQPKGR